MTDVVTHPSLAAGRQQAERVPRLGYLCGQYPAVSHTFVLREVLALRRRGIEVETFSIRRALAEHLLAKVDRAEYDSTFAILPPRWSRLLGAHAKLAASAPRAYLSTLALALKLAPAGWRGRLWQFFYFVETVMLWSGCNRRGIRHIHVHHANVAADVALLTAHLGCKLDGAGQWSWSFSMHGHTELFNVSHFRLAEKVRRARFVVCISDFTRSQLMSQCELEHWDKLQVVHCGVMVDHFKCDRERLAVGNAPSILCLGRLVPDKGQSILLQALALLAERGHRVELTLAGEGPSRPSLEALARDLGVDAQTAFVGAVGEDGLQELYANASIFCLPSFAEGVPGVLMEAMAMQLPVITTPIMGIPELVEDGLTGMLVPPGRPDRLADAIERLLGNPQLCLEMGLRARHKVVEEFNTERSAEQLHALFARMLAPAPTHRAHTPSEAGGASPGEAGDVGVNDQALQPA
jgi:colanic acid/amylovoran biosynthesis glycosyltransferase